MSSRFLLSHHLDGAPIVNFVEGIGQSSFGLVRLLEFCNKHLLFYLELSIVIFGLLRVFFLFKNSLVVVVLQTLDVHGADGVE